MVRNAWSRSLGIAIRTLDRWNRLGFGPPRIRYAGQIRYRLSSLARWVLSHETAPQSPAVSEASQDSKPFSQTPRRSPRRRRILHPAQHPASTMPRMVPPQMRVNMSNIENESAEFAVNCNPGTTAKSSPHPDKHQAKGHGKAMLNRIRAAHLAGTHLARRSLRAHRHFPEALVSVIAAGLDPWAGTTEEVRVSYIPKGSDRDDRRTTMEFGPENKALQYLVLS